MCIWQFIEQSDFFDTPYVLPVKNLPGGTLGADFYWQTRKGRASMISAKAGAAYDLFLVTGNEEFRRTSLRKLRKLLELQIREGEAARLFRDSFGNRNPGFKDCSCNYMIAGILFLADLVKAEPDASDASEWKAAPRHYCELFRKEFARTAYDSPAAFYGLGMNGVLPAGESLENTPIPLIRSSIQATSAITRHAFIFASAAKLLNQPEYRAVSQFCLDWIYGNNPLGTSCVTGIGFNHSRHNVYGQFFPSTPQIPGRVIHHLRDGEYDLPSAGMQLLALAEFRTP